MLALDFRAGNEVAARLQRSVGFTESGRLRRFVAVGSLRYGKLSYALDLRCTDPGRSTA